MSGYEIVRLGDIASLDESGETIHELVKGQPNIAFAEIKKNKKHFHKKITEVYCIVSGHGKIILDDNIEKLESGTVITIHPGTKHQVIADENIVKLFVISTPTYDKNDVYFD